LYLTSLGFFPRIASTIQSASIPDSNLTKDEQQALKRLKNDDNIVILPADKGRVTVVMDKTDYFDKMDALVNEKQTWKRKSPIMCITLFFDNDFFNGEYTLSVASFVLINFIGSISLN
jgi:hypothetical protein